MNSIKKNTLFLIALIMLSDLYLVHANKLKSLIAKNAKDAENPKSQVDVKEPVELKDNSNGSVNENGSVTASITETLSTSVTLPLNDSPVKKSNLRKETPPSPAPASAFVQLKKSSLRKQKLPSDL